MKNQLNFDQGNVPSVREALQRGLIGYATDDKKIGGITTIWLWLADGRILRIRSEMHDVSEWNEIGTLIFYIELTSEQVPQMITLEQSWLNIDELEKLVFESEDCSAESGIVIRNCEGEELTIVTGANVYTLEIDAPFISRDFNPENDINKYKRTLL